MSKLAKFLLLSIACVGCAGENPTPADPAAVERLLARLEARQAADADRLLSGKGRDKLNRAERLVAPLEKLPPEKIDPSVAAALVN